MGIMLTLRGACQVDRVVDMVFGFEEAAYHVIVELYASGNIILTDSTYTILNVLRQHAPDEAHQHHVGDVYPTDSARQHERIDAPRLERMISSATPEATLKQILLNETVYGPAILQHCIAPTGLKLNSKLQKELDSIGPDELSSKLMEALVSADDMVESLSGVVSKGYIVMKNPPKNGLDSTEAPMLYDEFVPFLFSQYDGRASQEYETFAEAVDEFFAKIEAQKIEAQVLAQQNEATKKVDRVRNAQAKQLAALDGQAHQHSASMMLEDPS